MTPLAALYLLENDVHESYVCIKSSGNGIEAESGSFYFYHVYFCLIKNNKHILIFP